MSAAGNGAVGRGAGARAPAARSLLLATGAIALLAGCRGTGGGVEARVTLPADGEPRAADPRPAVEAARLSLPPGFEVHSLLGTPLVAPPLPEGERDAIEAALAAARAEHLARPDDADALIAYARRLGQACRFREAVAVYSDGLRKHPDDARLYRFRGHRWITLRQFDFAVEDLKRAAQLVEDQPDVPEPSLTPNARGIDLDTLHENIWYHLALAHYLRGEWEPALAAWARCAALAPNDDGRAMCAYWSANAASRLGRPDEVAAAVAGVTAEMDIVEYKAYHQLALLWKGERDGEALLAAARAGEGGAGGVEFATLGYGVATWHRSRGDESAAQAVLDEVLASPSWYAFGYIAAEADRARER